MKTNTKTTFTTILMLMLCINAIAQGTLKGRVEDKAAGGPLPYVTVRVSKAGQKEMVKGAMTDAQGAFSISGLPYGKYDVQLSFVGYTTVNRQVTLSKHHPAANLGKIIMSDDANQLSEVTVTGQQSAMKLEVDRKTYDVSNDLSNIGASATDALENIPSVEVDNEGNISLRGSSSVEVWINGKASGLTADNRAAILEQIPAESIERIEVIDNPGAKFSAEGSAGIINIVMKRNRKAGRYGSVQAGANTAGGANASVNLNTNSKWIDSYATIGYRHREDESGAKTEQVFYNGNENENGNKVPSGYQNSTSVSANRGNNLFLRAGITLHATGKDDIALSGMFMHGGGNNSSNTPYYYYGSAHELTKTLTRHTTGRSNMNMANIGFDYRHNFTDRHFIELNVTHSSWHNRNNNIYQDRTVFYNGNGNTAESFQLRPQRIRNRTTELKLDYENPFSDKISLQAGYNARFNRENNPQEAWKSDNYDGEGMVEDIAYYNLFIYNMDTHAIYANLTMKWGKFGVMAGLRGEYWKVDTDSYDYWHNNTGFKKDFFKLFPSLFLSYQFTQRDQLQLNVTRRLRRPWGGQLNPFIDTRNASSVSFGNPGLTPEYSFSFQLNYLRTWDNHSLLLSAYYRPTTDVIQRVKYMVEGDDRTFQTYMNLSKSTNSGLEMTLKNKFARWFELTTSASAFNYKLEAFNYTLIDPLMGKPITVSGDSESRFSWNARIQANFTLPHDFTVQLKGNYRSKRVITQGSRRPSYSLDIGVRKSFFNRKLTLALNCRDLLDSKRNKSETSGDTFYQYSENWRHSRKVNFTATWSFGNNKPKRDKRNREENESEDDSMQTYEGGED